MSSCRSSYVFGSRKSGSLRKVRAKAYSILTKLRESVPGQVYLEKLFNFCEPQFPHE